MMLLRNLLVPFEFEAFVAGAVIGGGIGMIFGTIEGVRESLRNERSDVADNVVDNMVPATVSFAAIGGATMWAWPVAIPMILTAKGAIEYAKYEHRRLAREKERNIGLRSAGIKD